MTPTERAAFAAIMPILDQVTDTLDVRLPNTDDMWGLAEAMRAWNVRMPLAEYLALPADHPERHPRPAGHTFQFHSCVILAWTYAKLLGPVNTEDPHA